MKVVTINKISYRLYLLLTLVLAMLSLQSVFAFQLNANNALADASSILSTQHQHLSHQTTMSHSQIQNDQNGSCHSPLTGEHGGGECSSCCSVTGSVYLPIIIDNNAILTAFPKISTCSYRIFLPVDIRPPRNI